MNKKIGYMTNPSNHNNEKVVSDKPSFEPVSDGVVIAGHSDFGVLDGDK